MLWALLDGHNKRFFMLFVKVIRNKNHTNPNNNINETIIYIHMYNKNILHLI